MACVCKDFAIERLVTGLERDKQRNCKPPDCKPNPRTSPSTKQFNEQNNSLAAHKVSRNIFRPFA